MISASAPCLICRAGKFWEEWLSESYFLITVHSDEFLTADTEDALPTEQVRGGGLAALCSSSGFSTNPTQPLEPPPCVLDTKASLVTPPGKEEKGKIHAGTSAGSLQRESSLIQWPITSSPSFPRPGKYKLTQWPDKLSRATTASQGTHTLSREPLLHLQPHLQLPLPTAVIISHIKG